RTKNSARSSPTHCRYRTIVLTSSSPVCSLVCGVGLGCVIGQELRPQGVVVALSPVHPLNEPCIFVQRSSIDYWIPFNLFAVYGFAAHVFPFAAHLVAGALTDVQVGVFARNADALYFRIECGHFLAVI